MLRLLIVDDEAPARRRLRDVLADCAAAHPHVVVGEATNGREALDQVAALAPDVVLLDIRMPGMDGIECASHLQKLAAPPAVIFCTAYDAHACRAFELAAIDYVLKPVRAERLAQALERARRLVPGAQNAVRPPAPRSHLSLNEKGRIVLIPLADILYLKAELKYLTVRTETREYLLEESLARLESEFPDTFVRVHRNCLVAIARVMEIGKTPGDDDGHFVRLRGVDERIPASRRQYSLLRERINLY
jgi:two-component system response regulator AlgR